MARFQTVRPRTRSLREILLRLRTQERQCRCIVIFLPFFHSSAFYRRDEPALEGWHDGIYRIFIIAHAHLTIYTVVYSVPVCR